MSQNPVFVTVGYLYKIKDKLVLNIYSRKMLRQSRLKLFWQQRVTVSSGSCWKVAEVIRGKVKFIILIKYHCYAVGNTSICSWFSTEVWRMSKRSFKLRSRRKATHLMQGTICRQNSVSLSVLLLLRNSWRQQIADGTSYLLALAPSGRGLAVVDTPGLGWRNGPLPSMWSDDDDDDDDDDCYYIMYAVHHGLAPSPMPALLHGTRYRMNFDKHLLSTASNATSRLIFLALLLRFS